MTIQILSTTITFSWTGIGQTIIFFAAIIAALVLIMKQMGLFGKKARAIFAKQISNEIADSPTVIQMRADVDRVLVNIDHINETLVVVSGELNFNSGSTVKDQVHLLLQNQETILKDQEHLALRVGQMHRVVMDSKIAKEIATRKDQQQ